jgi:hypothetical protein
MKSPQTATGFMHQNIMRELLGLGRADCYVKSQCSRQSSMACTPVKCGTSHALIWRYIPGKWLTAATGWASCQPAPIFQLFSSIFLQAQGVARDGCTLELLWMSECCAVQSPKRKHLLGSAMGIYVHGLEVKILQYCSRCQGSYVVPVTIMLLPVL